MVVHDVFAETESASYASHTRNANRLDTSPNTATCGHRVPFAVVHHANQYLITDGYENREGISQIVQGYAAALRLHERYKVPASLHLSGTLIEAIAWHCPWFLQLVRELLEQRILSLVGGTYAENVMPLFSPAFNLRQLNEHLWLYKQHLGCAPDEVKICWVPERVWDPKQLISVLTSEQLVNGGYRFVLLDDRLLWTMNGSYQGSPRALFDASNWPEVDRVYRIAGADGLEVIPISISLRYSVPPLAATDWTRLDEAIRTGRQRSDDAILVYADDMEKTAGVGGWDRSALGRYDAFLRWLTARQDVVPVHLAEWLRTHPAQTDAPVEAGTYFELAQSWQAGEDYRMWWQDAAWGPYRSALAAAQEGIRAAEKDGADARLLDLARKHLLAATYETAWHDPGRGGDRYPAPWARAVAIHSRSCLVIAAAARWFARSVRPCAADQLDLDADGEDEVVLRNEHLYAVVSPGRGARLVYLFVLTPRGGALVIGNPSDDWHFQEQQNRYMDQPPNHPGALADVGHEHDEYQVGACGIVANSAYVELINTEAGSRLCGVRKRLLLPPRAADLVVCYRLAQEPGQFATQVCLSPDYYWLLREGRYSLVCSRGASWQQACNNDVSIKVEIDCVEQTALANPPLPEVAHALAARVEAHKAHFHLLIGCGAVDESSRQHRFQTARDAIDPTASDTPLIPVDSYRLASSRGLVAARRAAAGVDLDP